ncbi:hypothetical protein DHEL01_v201078 [Diaporthe helianthi]|uniref:WSC domain-containing protein n=1 Tax=Diaporthe helianthi TaxID=158607 RepID=A0A2P5IDG6_DIAHE|nr:hypothetical protein DHEL01_v201078 [Diaporthe helianthi]
MYRHSCSGALLALATVLLGFASADPTYPFEYCASSNSGEGSSESSIYQSQGLCYGTCKDGGYAFAVLQNSECWCSNLVPSSDDQTSTSNCESSCPGYPTDFCGGDGTYGYIALGPEPSGTAGGSSKTTSSTSKTTSSLNDSGIQALAMTTTTEIHTETETETVVQTSVTITSDTPLPSTSLTSVKSSATATSTSTTEPETTSTTPKTTSEKPTAGTPTTITAVQTVTSEGSVIIQTVTTVSTPSAQSDSSGLGKGAVAGLTVGIIAAIAAFIAGALMFRRHKRRMREEEEPMNAASMANRRGSSAGIMSKTGTMSSVGYGMPMDEENSYLSQSRRLSMKPLDPRLDPKVGLYRTASHDSFNTIRDDQDYSRRVHQPPRAFRVTNPDPVDD